MKFCSRATRRPRSERERWCAPNSGRPSKTCCQQDSVRAGRGGGLLLRDRSARRRCGASGILLAALAYFVMPVDTIPDIFAVVGFTDDIAVLTAAIAMIRGHIKDGHYEAADQAACG